MQATSVPPKTKEQFVFVSFSRAGIIFFREEGGRSRRPRRGWPLKKAERLEGDGPLQGLQITLWLIGDRARELGHANLNLGTPDDA